jgi:hypothetical protein
MFVLYTEKMYNIRLRTGQVIPRTFKTYWDDTNQRFGCLYGATKYNIDQLTRFYAKETRSDLYFEGKLTKFVKLEN